MNMQRTAKLFRNGRNQAVRIPREFELPGTEVVMRREGGRLIIEFDAPSGPNARLLAVLAAMEPLGPEDEFPEIPDQTPGPVEL